MGKTQLSKRQIGDRIAFYAQMATEQDLTNSVETKIEFDTEVFDYGSAFDPATYTFTAPVKGIYQFNISLRYSTIDDARFGQALLVTSNTDMGDGGTLTGFVESVTANDFIYPQLSVIVELDKDDTAYVSGLHNNGDTQSVDTSDGFTFFMGHLVMRLE